jgi:hypothetical protein
MTTEYVGTPRTESVPSTDQPAPSSSAGGTTGDGPTAGR